MKTKNKDKKMSMITRVLMILDQSGSMGGTKAQAVQGYNEQVQQMKLNSKTQKILASLITFNGEVFEHMWDVPAEELTEASAEDYRTEGSTAMRDAVGYGIEKLQKTADPNEKDVAYLVVIISDGEENASSHYSESALRELKDSVDRTGKWTFTYMGCDEKYLKKVAHEMNIPISNVAKWSNSRPELAAKGMHQNAVKMRSYYSARAGGQTTNSNVYSEKLCMADFTKDEVADEPAVVGDADVLKSVLGKPSHLWKPNPTHLVDPNLNVNMNVLNDGHTTTCNTSPFNNYSPVSWKA